MCTAALAAGLVWAAAARAETPIDIMRASHQVSRVRDSLNRSTFLLASSGGHARERKTAGWSKLQPNGRDNARLTRFLAPPDVKGTAILLIEHEDGDDEIWIWLPALRKVRRLVSSNKKDNFLGTDLSYGDVIGHRVESWEHRLTGEEEVDGAPCFVIESTPRSDRVKGDSGYARRMSWVRKDNFVAVRGEFWDEAGRPLKTTRARELRQIDVAANRWQAMLIEARNVQTGHSTTIRIDDLKVNQGIPDDRFTTRALERE
jgi:hypothetical protein